MSDYIWKVKALKSTGKVAPGMEVEVIKRGTTAAPNIKEIGAAFERKYGICLIGGCSTSNFEIKAIK